MRYRKRREPKHLFDLARAMQESVEVCKCSLDGLCECMYVSPPTAERLVEEGHYHKTGRAKDGESS